MEELWRGSIARKGKEGAKPCDMELPAKATRWLHVSILEKLGKTSCQCTCLSESMVVDPLSTSRKMVMYQIPADIDEEPWRIVVKLQPQAVKAALAVHLLSLQPLSSTGNETEDKVVYTANSFQPNKSGRDAMMAYMDVCKQLYEKSQGKLMLDARWRHSGRLSRANCASPALQSTVV